MPSLAASCLNATGSSVTFAMTGNTSDLVSESEGEVKGKGKGGGKGKNACTASGCTGVTTTCAKQGIGGAGAGLAVTAADTTPPPDW